MMVAFRRLQRIKPSKMPQFLERERETAARRIQVRRQQPGEYRLENSSQENTG